MLQPYDVCFTAVATFHNWRQNGGGTYKSVLLSRELIFVWIAQTKCIKWSYSWGFRAWCHVQNERVGFMVH